MSPSSGAPYNNLAARGSAGFTRPNFLRMSAAYFAVLVRPFVCRVTMARYVSSVVGLLSVVRCPSCGHILKKTQDRPELLLNSVIKLASLILLPQSDSPPDAPLGRYSGFKYNTCAIYQYGLLFDLASDHSCCKPSMTIVSPLLLPDVEFDARNLLFTVIIRYSNDAKVA